MSLSVNLQEWRMLDLRLHPYERQDFKCAVMLTLYPERHLGQQIGKFGQKVPHFDTSQRQLMD